MIDRGFKVQSIDELVEACKNDSDFDVDHWTFNEKAKALWLYNAKNQQTVIMLKIDDSGITVKSVW